MLSENGIHGSGVYKDSGNLAGRGGDRPGVGLTGSRHTDQYYLVVDQRRVEVAADNITVGDIRSVCIIGGKVDA